MRTFFFGACLALACLAANFANAQYVTSYYAPVVAGYTPAVTDYGFGPAYSPSVSYYSNTAVAPTTAYYAPSVVPTTTYYAPGVATAVAPVTTYYAPTAAVPVTSYYAPAAVPVTSYYAPAAVPVTAYYGRASYWVAPPKVYVAGEPVRNFFRVLTP